MAWHASLLEPGQRKIDATRWVDAWLENRPVGCCDRCRRGMFVAAQDGQPITEVGPATWFRARCVGCGAEATSMRGVLTPGQRVTYDLPLEFEVDPRRPGEREAS